VCPGPAAYRAVLTHARSIAPCSSAKPIPALAGATERTEVCAAPTAMSTLPEVDLGLPPGVLGTGTA
jgi:hypothetical protein